MFDFNKESDVALCAWTNTYLAYYLPQSSKIGFVQKKPHHYYNEVHITELVESISHELFQYSNSLRKATDSQAEGQCLQVLLQNICSIFVHNLDKRGMIVEQKFLYLVVGFLKAKIAGNVREWLIEVHYLISINNENPTNNKSQKQYKQQPEQIPQSLTMLLNSQFQELLEYSKQSIFPKSNNSNLIQLCIQLLLQQIQYPQPKNVELIRKELAQNQEFQRFLAQVKKRASHTSGLWEWMTDGFQLQMLVGILAGNQHVIEAVSKGSWSLYLNLYMGFVLRIMPNINAQDGQLLATKNNQNQRSYQSIAKAYITKHLQSIKSNKPIPQTQQFLIKLLCSDQPSSRFSFHDLYQSTFNIFSPVLSHLIGLLMLECRVVDLFTIMNNQEYDDEIIWNWLQSCSQTSWGALVYAIGFVTRMKANQLDDGDQQFDRNQKYERNKTNGKNQSYENNSLNQINWQNLLFSHLPYEFTQGNHTSQSIQSQIRLIQQKLSDLNLLGMNRFVSEYLLTFFNLELSPSRSLNNLNVKILELFFLLLEYSNQQASHSAFHQMKLFMRQYYRTRQFDYALLEELEKIFERKQNGLGQKVQKKIQKLFRLAYKVRSIELIDPEAHKDHVEPVRKIELVQKLQEFNKLFIHTDAKHSNTTSCKIQKSLTSLCFSLLILAKNLHLRSLFLLNLLQEQALSTQCISPESQEITKLVHDFQLNLKAYIKRWKAFGKIKQTDTQIDHQDMIVEEPSQTQNLPQDVIKLINEFNEWFD